MIFLQPLLLVALPLIALPIVIHLINQRRYQTMPWAAMMFLVAANRMSRGYVRIRQWLILLLRSLVIAALIFAISRPLASGWIGGAVGAAADTTIVLIDRSPSMQQRSRGSAASKLETGIAQLARTLGALGSPHYVLIESATNEPRQLESIDSLATLPQVGPLDAAADVPAMLLAALDCLDANQSGRTDIWICSDLRENDWRSTDARWQTLRQAFAALGPRVRLRLLAYPERADDNRSIRVTGVEREETDDGAQLRVSLQIKQQTGEGKEHRVPIELEIGGARSVIDAQWTGSVFELKDHPIPISRELTRGHGRVSIPADANPADNDFYFVFDHPAPRQTVIVADDPVAAAPLQLAATIAPNQGVTSTANVVERKHLPSVAWEQVALLLWQGPLPESDEAAMVSSFVDAGGRAIFFPPRSANDATLFGIGWEAWHDSDAALSVTSWRGDADLLRHTLSGGSLSVGQLQIDHYGQIRGEATPLATLENGAPLLVRAPTERGGAYFCATTPHPEHSTLAANGVVMYVMVQRAIAAGAEALGNVHQRVAGRLPLANSQASTNSQGVAWTQLAGPATALSTEFPFRAGIYAGDDRRWGVNRPAAEDHSAVLADEKLRSLFVGLQFQRVDDQAGNLQSLVQEIWRLFLIGMMAAMLIEAALCLPTRTKTSSRSEIRGAAR